MRNPPQPRLLALALHAALLALPAVGSLSLLPQAAQAQSAPATYRFDIPAGPLSTALTRIAAQAGVQLTVNAELTAGKNAPAIKGGMSLSQALERALAGSGLEAVAQPGGGLVLRRQAAAASVPGTVLQTVVVLGSRDPSVPLSNVPASITVVPREEIARQQPTAQRIEDILGRTVPGFNPTNVGVRQIRGRTAQVFVNGVPSNEQLRASAGSDLNLLAPDQLEVIEVARGANSAYGFGSPGGVIALSTRRAESQELRLTSRVGTSFNTSKPGGTFQSSLYQAASQIVGDFDYHAGVALRKDGLVRDPDGNPALDFNSPAMFSMGKESLFDFDTSLGYRLGGTGTLRLTATAGRAEVDEGYASDETGTYRRVNSNLVRRTAGDRNVRRYHTVNLSYENPDVAGSAVKLEAVASRVNTLQFARVGAVTRRDDQTNSYTGLRSSVTTPLDGWQRGASVSYGLDYMRNRFFRPVFNDATGAVVRYFSPDVTLNILAPYLQGQVPVGDWRFNAGLRHERYSGNVETAVGTGGIQGGDIRSFNLTLFNAGAVYTLQPGRELYASFSQGAEISQVGRAATVAGIADRVNTQPAKSNQYEIGFRQRSGALDYSVAAFYTTSDLMSATQRNPADPTGPLIPLREPRKFWGVEGTVGWRIDSQWGVGGTLGWMNGERTLPTGEERRIPSNETPPLLLSTHVDYAPRAGWTNRLQFDYRASRDPFGSSTAFGEGRVDSVFLAHLSTSFDVGSGELQIGLRNLFDKKYYSIVSQAHNFGFLWIPEQGRRLSVSYSMQW